MSHTTAVASPHRREIHRASVDHARSRRSSVAAEGCERDNKGEEGEEGEEEQEEQEEDKGAE